MTQDVGLKMGDIHLMNGYHTMMSEKPLKTMKII